MKKKRNLYIVAFLCFITLVGVTIAYLQSQDVFENIFNAGTYSVTTHEEFISPDNWKPGDTTPKTIETTNDGTIPVMVRVKFDESWNDSNGDPLDLTFNNNSNLENVSIINLDNTDDWKYRDGYYYYIYELLPGEDTTSPISSVTFNPNYSGSVTCTYNSTTNSNECSSSDEYMGGQYKLTITTETVQAEKYSEVWNNIPVLNYYVGDNPCTYDGELIPGATYINGQYTYKYMQEGNENKWIDNNSNVGWGVKISDRTSTAPVTTLLCSSINNKPIVSMSSMFYNVFTTDVDLSSFDTSNVTNMSKMFYYSRDTSLDFTNFDTSNVTDMSHMFEKSKAVILDLSSFDTSNVTNMKGMFSGSEATTLDLSSFNTSKVENMYGMFSHSEVMSPNLSNFNTSKVTNMGYMFCGCQSTSLDLSNFDTSNVENMYGMFWGSEVTILNISSFNTSAVEDMSHMFAETKLTSINLSNFDTTSVIDMSSMFYSALVTSINLSSFNTSNVTNMNHMFCNSLLTTLDLSSFDTSNVTDMEWLVSGSQITTGYGKTQADCDRLNASRGKPSGLTFVVKGS